MTINQIQNEIIDEFSDIDDWMDRYAYIIDLGNTLPPIDEKIQDPAAPHRRLPEPRMDQRRPHTGKPCALRSRLRRHNRERHHRTAHQSARRPTAAGHPQCRSLFHRPDRTVGTPVTHPVQRTACHGKADENICIGIFLQEITNLKFSHFKNLTIRYV